jgi:hypothetical protein
MEALFRLKHCGLRGDELVFRESSIGTGPGFSKGCLGSCSAMLAGLQVGSTVHAPVTV